MKPPFFVWKSGILDVFDTVADLEQRYPAVTLTGDDVALYDGAGRMLVARAKANGTTRIVCDDRQASHPDRLAASLRGYLVRGGVSAETASSLTLSELIQEVYPSSAPAGRSIRVRKTRKLSQPPVPQPDSKQGFDRLFRAFGIAVLAGVITASIAVYFALMYVRSVRSLSASPGFGSMHDDAIRLLEAAIVGALIGGNIVFLCTLLHFGLFGAETGERIGCAFVALAAILVLVGGAVLWIWFCIFAR